MDHPTPNFDRLKPIEQRFITEYLSTGKIYESFKAAGYKGVGNSGRVNSSRLLKTKKIQLAIAELQQPHTEQCKNAIGHIQERALQCATFDADDLCPQEWPDELKKCVSSITVTIDPKGGQTITILFDRHKHMKFLTDSSEQGGPKTKSDRQEELQKFNDDWLEMTRAMEATIPGSDQWVLEHRNEIEQWMHIEAERNLPENR